MLDRTLPFVKLNMKIRKVEQQIRVYQAIVDQLDSLDSVWRGRGVERQLRCQQDTLGVEIQYLQMKVDQHDSALVMFDQKVPGIDHS